MAKVPGINSLKPDNEKNYLINGDMRITQRNTSFAAVATGAYTLDRWLYTKVGAVVHTVTRDTECPTILQSGYAYTNSLKLDVTTIDAAIAAGDKCYISQRVEGYNFAKIAQKRISLSFWVKAIKTGIYCVAFQNSGLDRSYVAEYTINASNTWEYKTVTIAASPSAGTWDYINGVGLEVVWTLAAGTTFQTTAGAWQTGNFVATANQVNGVDNAANDFWITGTMLNEGVVPAPYRLFGEGTDGEVAACQRYYEKSYALTTNPGTVTTAGNARQYMFLTSSGSALNPAYFRVSKRTSPTSVIYSTNSGASGNLYDDTAAVDRAAGVANSSTECISCTSDSALPNGQRFIRWQWSSDAEL